MMLRPTACALVAMIPPQVSFAAAVGRAVALELLQN
jgi:hypothetical protein